jgi:hypothetical protein
VGRCEAVKIKVVSGGRRRLCGVNIVVGVTVSMRVRVEVVIHISVILSVRGVRIEADRISML